MVLWLSYLLFLSMVFSSVKERKHFLLKALVKYHRNQRAYSGVFRAQHHLAQSKHSVSGSYLCLHSLLMYLESAYVLKNPALWIFFSDLLRTCWRLLSVHPLCLVNFAVTALLCYSCTIIQYRHYAVSVTCLPPPVRRELPHGRNHGSLVLMPLLHY